MKIDDLFQTKEIEFEVEGVPVKMREAKTVDQYNVFGDYDQSQAMRSIYPLGAKTILKIGDIEYPNGMPTKDFLKLPARISEVLIQKYNELNTPNPTNGASSKK